MAINTPNQAYIDSTTPPKKKVISTQSTQGNLNFAEIHDGVVIMRDGSLRAIIMCSPTNYDLKSPNEKDAIEFAYQGFLNGLHFPIQISIQSRKIDLKSYLDMLDKKLGEQSNPMLAGLMEDYIYNIRDLLNTVNIMDKKFFVVVPFFVAEAAKGSFFKQLAASFVPAHDVKQSTKQFDQRKRELVGRTNAVAQGLAAIGVRAAVLKTQEIIELFYDSYNLEEALAESLVNTQDMTTPIVQREGGLPQPYTAEPKEVDPPDLYDSARADVNNDVASGANGNGGKV